MGLIVEPVRLNVYQFQWKSKSSELSYSDICEIVASFIQIHSAGHSGYICCKGYLIKKVERRKKKQGVLEL